MPITFMVTSQLLNRTSDFSEQQKDENKRQSYCCTCSSKLCPSRVLFPCFSTSPNMVVDCGLKSLGGPQHHQTNFVHIRSESIQDP